MCVVPPKPPLPSTHLLLGPAASQAHQVLPSSVAILREATGGPQRQLPLNVGRQGLPTGDLNCGLGPPGRESHGGARWKGSWEVRPRPPHTPSILLPFCFGPQAFPIYRFSQFSYRPGQRGPQAQGRACQSEVSFLLARANPLCSQSRLLVPGPARHLLLVSSLISQISCKDNRKGPGHKPKPTAKPGTLNT